MCMLSTGLELVLNASENLLQIVVTDNETLLCFQEWNTPQKATEILAPALQEICAALRMRLRDFRRIACVRGPGSFTGIRLVLATAAALRRASHARLAGLDYMQALATSATIGRQLLYGVPVCVLTHARRNLVHFRPFVSFWPQIPAQPTGQTTLCPPHDLVAEITAHAAVRQVYICGSGLVRNAAVFEACGLPTGLCRMPELVSPSVGALRLLARHGDYFPNDIEPLYIRHCDAVENLPLLAKCQGMDSAVATATLKNMLRRPPQSEI